MKKILSSLIVTSLLASNVAWAECDFSTIKKVPEGYLYTKECHVQVGKNVKELKAKKEEVKELRKAIELKDLALKVSYDRVERWQTTTFKLEDRVNTIEKYNDAQKVLYFVIGVGVTSLAVWGAGQLK